MIWSLLVLVCAVAALALPIIFQEEIDMKTITAEILKYHGACIGQVDQFRRIWPDGCEITVANMLKAQEEGLEVSWLGDEECEYEDGGILSPEEAEEYHKVMESAQREYDQVLTPAYEELNTSRAPVLEEWGASIKEDEAHQKYDEACAPILAKFDADMAPARAVYHQARAVALVAALRSQK